MQPKDPRLNSFRGNFKIFTFILFEMVKYVLLYPRVQQEKKKEMQKIVCLHFKQGRCVFGDKCLKNHGNPTKKLEYSTPVIVAAPPSEPKTSQPPETVESLMKQKSSKSKKQKASKKSESAQKAAGGVKSDLNSNLVNGDNIVRDNIRDSNDGGEDGEQINYVEEVVEEER